MGAMAMGAIAWVQWRRRDCNGGGAIALGGAQSVMEQRAFARSVPWRGRNSLVEARLQAVRPGGLTVPCLWGRWRGACAGAKTARRAAARRRAPSRRRAEAQSPRPRHAFAARAGGGGRCGDADAPSEQAPRPQHGGKAQPRPQVQRAPRGAPPGSPAARKPARAHPRSGGRDRRGRATPRAGRPPASPPARPGRPPRDGAATGVQHGRAREARPRHRAGL